MALPPTAGLDPRPYGESVMAATVTDLYVCDQYRFADLLTDAERAVPARLRTVLDLSVGPLLDEYWEKGEFPPQVMPDLVALNLMEPDEILATGARPSALNGGFRNVELARTDASVATMYNALSGLFRATAGTVGVPPKRPSSTRWSGRSACPACSR